VFLAGAGPRLPVVDSTGVVIQYVYDPVLNTLVTPGALATFTASPQTASTGGTLTIQGQGYSTTPSLNIVIIGGTAVTVLPAISSTIVVAIPATGITGTISITISGSSTTSVVTETVVPAPIISSIIPRVAQGGTTAILTDAASANVDGRFAMTALHTSVNFPLSATPARAFGVFTDPGADAEVDGLAHAYEIVVGTDPFARVAGTPVFISRGAS